MDIGLFQLENLFANPNRFLFFDLRETRENVHPDLDPMISKARPAGANDVAVILQYEKVPLDFPVVLICEDGKTSAQTALSLEKKGHDNVYVVEGGIKNLLSEL